MCLNIFNKKGKISEITQNIIPDFINDIFCNIKKRREPNMNELLDEIVNQISGLDLIIILSLKSGLPMYYSIKDPNVYKTFFGRNDIGVALKDFANLKQVDNALDSFGRATNSGSLLYSIFKLDKGQLMVYFYDLPDTKVAICFFALDERISLGALIYSGESYIKKIQNGIPNQ